MANGVYSKYKQSIITEADTLNGLNTTGTNGTFVALVDTGTYTVSLTTHQFYSSLAGIVGTDMEITTPTVTNGTFDGDNVTFVAVSGASVEALVLYRKNSGANTTWRLVVFMDSSVTGLPVTPNGGDITVAWNVSGIFTISDVRAKENIVQVGELNTLPVYEYNYIGGVCRYTGVLAQEAERVVPSAVIEINGRKMVNYAGLIDSMNGGERCQEIRC